MPCIWPSAKQKMMLRKSQIVAKQRGPKELRTRQKCLLVLRLGFSASDYGGLMLYLNSELCGNTEELSSLIPVTP